MYTPASKQSSNTTLLEVKGGCELIINKHTAKIIYPSLCKLNSQSSIKKLGLLHCVVR
jgi:hypothetical protein